MTEHDQQFSDNSSQVRDAERRLAIQHVFIERLRASGNDTRSAEKALEVMRDILRELYSARSRLRRKVRASQRRSGRDAAHQKIRWRALATNSSRST